MPFFSITSRTLATLSGVHISSKRSFRKSGRKKALANMSAGSFERILTVWSTIRSMYFWSESPSGRTSSFL